MTKLTGVPIGMMTRTRTIRSGALKESLTRIDQGTWNSSLSGGFEYVRYIMDIKVASESIYAHWW